METRFYSRIFDYSYQRIDIAGLYETSFHGVIGIDAIEELGDG